MERNDREKLQGSDIEITPTSPFLKKLSDFWYYNKWKVIIITLFAIVIIVGIVQMATKEKYDLKVTVATHTIYYRENLTGLEASLVSLMPDDVNGDGKKNLQLSYYKIYSEAEMKEANEAETDEYGHPVIYADEAYNKSQMQEFNSYLMTGECTVMILSEYLYNDLIGRREEDILIKPLGEIFGDELPKGAMSDGYGVRLSETYAYEFLEGFHFLPEDTVICIMRPYAWGASSDKEAYAAALEYFKSIVTFGE